MIRLKNTLLKKNNLFEQRGDEQRKKLHVLIIGTDDVIDTSSSFSKKLLNIGIITADIKSVNKKEYTSNKINRLINSNITDEYDVVVIMCNITEPKQYTYNQTISNLNDAFNSAKQFDAKLICVIGKNSPNLVKINKWIDSVQTYSDDIIDINESISIENTDTQSDKLTDEIQNQITKQLLRLFVNYIKTIETMPSTSDESERKNDYLWILSDLQAQADAKLVINSLNYGDKNNLQWLASAEAWEDAENDYDIVYKIQMQLSKLKYQIGSRGANGEYNSDTERAIKKFQEINDLAVTGRLDLKTVARLFHEDAKTGDYSPIEKIKKQPLTIDVDQAWLSITNKIIDNFEGGYWNNDKTQPADKICSNHPYSAMYANSGETLFGLDRRAGKIDKIEPYGRQFFEIIDAERERLGSEFCKVWHWNYRGGDKEEELKLLASKTMKHLYDSFSKQFLSSEALKIVESNKQLLFHFAYATWNGPGFFQSFGRSINAAVKEGKSTDELIDIAIADRNAKFGGTDWSTANKKVVDIIKNDKDLKEQKRMQMKNSIFDINNKEHIRILKEELSRAKRLLREYNESEIWKNLSSDTRRKALMTVDAEMGSDFADEYAGTEWMQIPDAITNRLDIKRFDIPNDIDPYKLASFIEQNSSMLPSEPWFKASVGPKLKTPQIVKLLQSGLTSTKQLTKDIIGTIITIAPDMNIDYTQLLSTKVTGSVIPASQQGNNNITNPSKNKTGGYWTGD